MSKHQGIRYLFGDGSRLVCRSVLFQIYSILCLEPKQREWCENLVPVNNTFPFLQYYQSVHDKSELDSSLVRWIYLRSLTIYSYWRANMDFRHSRCSASLEPVLLVPPSVSTSSSTRRIPPRPAGIHRMPLLRW